jgi:hypothetical protein
MKKDVRRIMELGLEKPLSAPPRPSAPPRETRCARNVDAVREELSAGERWVTNA